MAACGLEVGTFAERLLVDVDGVLAHREVLEIDADNDLVAFAVGEGGSAGVFAVGGLEVDDERLHLGGEGGHGDEADRESCCGKAHGAFLLKEFADG
jgi:hypothetical protein